MPHGTSRGARPVLPAAPFAAVVLAVIVLVAACGEAGTGSVGDGGGTVPPSRPARQPTPTGGEPVPMPSPGVVSPVAGKRERSVAWRLVRPVSGPAVLVEVQVGGAPCDVVTGFEAVESAAAVRLTVWAGREPGARCDGIPATLGTYHLRVPLSEPLGHRSLDPS